MKCIYCDQEIDMEELLDFEYIYCCGFVQTEEQRDDFYNKLFHEILKS